ncbi:MAG: tetratricopeptide (TPR) repeat protein [Planctomycetota bacterium]|jgi:tetratricopeptide (TPR) repeat protein
MTTISACLIVRNEEQILDACLEALGPFVDEICVVDTGSTDRTFQIAEASGAKLERFVWIDDFAAARNACLNLATSDWILSVDADEILDPESAEGLRLLLEHSDAQAYLVWLDNLDGGSDANGRPSMNSVGIPRLFRRRPEIHWKRPVHESVMISLLALGAGVLEHSHLRLVHHGYLPEAIRVGKKHERNLRILEAQHEREPDDLFNTFKLASTQRALSNEDRACKLLTGAWSQARNQTARQRAELPFLPLAASELIRLLSAKGEQSRAWQVAQEALADYPTVSEVLYRAGEVQRCVGSLERASELYVAALGCEAWTDLYAGEPSSRGHWAHFGLARVSALAGDLELSLTCVERGLQMMPNSIEGRGLATRLMSASGSEVEAWRTLDQLLEEAPGNPHVLLLAAEMAWAKCEVQMARGFWSAALALPSSRQAARAWLAMADLADGDFASASEHGKLLLAADLPEAGALAVLANVAEGPLLLDPLFNAAAVAGEVRTWLIELEKDERGLALAAFAKGSPV